MSPIKEKKESHDIEIDSDASIESEEEQDN